LEEKRKQLKHLEGFLKMISDYNLYTKEIIESVDSLNKIDFDLFISAFEPCERVILTFKEVKAKQKIWLAFPQYEILTKDLPREFLFQSNELTEDAYFHDFFAKYPITEKTKICIDITGFIRPHLIYLIRFLEFIKISKISILYTEPKQYTKGENTKFSGFISDVRVIPGCGSSYSHITDNDMLILGVGYDDKLIAKVAQFKRNCKIKYEIFGFPSLQPDMYQESVLKSANVKETVGENIVSRFAPAYDPFQTAELIDNIIESSRNVNNIYLSPLSSKPQVLGFAFYYCKVGYKKPVSIIYPYSDKYLINTTIGSSRTWHYVLEF